MLNQSSQENQIGTNVVALDPIESAVKCRHGGLLDESEDFSASLEMTPNIFSLFVLNPA